jgi:predicted nucleic acid-binding protein
MEGFMRAMTKRCVMLVLAVGCGAEKGGGSEAECFEQDGRFRSRLVLAPSLILLSEAELTCDDAFAGSGAGERVLLMPCAGDPRRRGHARWRVPPARRHLHGPGVSLNTFGYSGAMGSRHVIAPATIKLCIGVFVACTAFSGEASNICGTCSRGRETRARRTVTAVIDASLAVEYLLRTTLGIKVAPQLEGETLLAPELLDAEVFAVFRRAVLTKELDARRAEDALADLDAWDLERISHRRLLQRAWEFRANVSGYQNLRI